MSVRNWPWISDPLPYESTGELEPTAKSALAAEPFARQSCANSKTPSMKSLEGAVNAERVGDDNAAATIAAKTPQAAANLDTFDYASLTGEAVSELAKLKKDIETRKEDVLEKCCEIGACYARARTILKGRFRDWIQKATQDSRSTVYNYIALFDNFSDLCPIVGHINTKTLYELARPVHASIKDDVVAQLTKGDDLCDADVQKAIGAAREERKRQKELSCKANDIGGDQEETNVEPRSIQSTDQEDSGTGERSYGSSKEHEEAPQEKKNNKLQKSASIDDGGKVRSQCAVNREYAAVSTEKYTNSTDESSNAESLVNIILRYIPNDRQSHVIELFEHTTATHIRNKYAASERKVYGSH